MINLALEVAARAHDGQFRKGTDIPYITHPFAVGILLLKSGCSEEVVMAGLLHDTLEDTSLTVEEIRLQQKYAHGKGVGNVGDVSALAELPIMGHGPLL